MLKPNSKPVLLIARSSFIVKRLSNGLEKYEKGTLQMPCTVPIKSVSITNKKSSWFCTKTSVTCKVLIRVENYEEEGLNSLLTESAMVIMWGLWNPLIGDSKNSRTAIDRFTREKKYAKPAEFLISFIDDKTEELVKRVGNC